MRRWLWSICAGPPITDLAASQAFERHRDLFEVEPQATDQRPPAALYRGLTCQRCLTRQPLARLT